MGANMGITFLSLISGKLVSRCLAGFRQAILDLSGSQLAQNMTAASNGSGNEEGAKEAASTSAMSPSARTKLLHVVVSILGDVLGEM
jgi:hypothetical protein